MRDLQLEHAEWIAKKYPNQEPLYPAVGCLEEAGELVHCILKLKQIGQWGEDARHKDVELRHKLIDAIGDCGIYAISLCNANGWNFERIWDEAQHSSTGMAMTDAIMLTRRATDLALEPARRYNLAAYLWCLVKVANDVVIEPDMAIRHVWLTVKER